MDIIHITFTSLFSIITLFFLTKITGNRQLSHMTMFDYINSITIGSIAAEFATSLENDFVKPLVAMIIYALADLAISTLTNKSLMLRKFFAGQPIILYEDGKIYKENMKKAKMDVNEFLTQCRVGGYFDLSQLQSATLETNGQISFLPLSESRPITPEDLNMTPTAQRPLVNLIVDGHVMEKNLKFTGNNDVWLKKQMETHNTKASDVFLATCNAQNELTIYKKIDAYVEHDIYE